MLTIGQFSKRARVSTDTVRFYERQGLIISTSRTTSGYRLYNDYALRRLAFIKHAQQCGFSLDDIRSLLSVPDAYGPASADACRVALEKKDEIKARIAALHAMSEALSGLIADYSKSGAGARRTRPLGSTLLDMLEAAGAGGRQHEADGPLDHCSLSSVSLNARHGESSPSPGSISASSASGGAMAPSANAAAPRAMSPPTEG